jgi:hypothetical protein
MRSALWKCLRGAAEQRAQRVRTWKSLGQPSTTRTHGWSGERPRAASKSLCSALRSLGDAVFIEVSTASVFCDWSEPTCSARRTKFRVDHIASSRRFTRHARIV